MLLRGEIKTVAPFCISLACDRDYSARDSKEKETDFIDCIAWRSTEEFVCKYFTKGRMMAASG